jgi:UDP-N-acetylmuramate dehydrogenase
MNALQKFMEKIIKTDFAGEIRYNEPMSLHTTFKVGGNADLWIKPYKEIFLPFTKVLLYAAKFESIPVFILGGGANLVVSDEGIRGIVLDTGFWSGCDFFPNKEEVIIRAGTQTEKAVEELAAQGLGGLEFLAGLPGSIGGALWMNARCYEKSISDVLIETKILDESLNETVIPFKAEDYDYKKSPFQNRKVLILSARFAVKKRCKTEILEEMEKYKLDRENKGHYRFPSAGSVFKNNKNFGKPTGKIIDELGLKGLSIGGAQVAPWHGNIIINT